MAIGAFVVQQLLYKLFTSQYQITYHKFNY